MTSAVVVTTLFPLVGLVIAGICLLIVVREGRTAVTLSNLCAALALCLALVLWAPAHGQRVDSWLGWPGAGAVAARLAISAGATLHAIAVCLGVGRWDRTRRLWLVPAMVIGNLLYVLCWRLSWTAPHATQTFYSLSYQGRPDTVFGMSLARGTVEIWYCTFGASAYVLATRRFQHTVRWTTALSSTALCIIAYGAATITGLCTIGEALADRAGVAVPWLSSLYVLSFLIAVALFAAVYLRGAVLKPLWRWIRQLLRSQETLREIRAATADALDVNSHIDDKLVLMIDYADPTIIRETKRACSTQRMAPDDRLLLLTAAMIVTLRPENADRRRQKGDQIIDTLTKGSLDHLAGLAATDVFFFSDAALVAALACGAEELGITLRRRTTSWHRQLAAVLAAVLERYEQPEQYRAAYRRELLRRDEEKRRMVADLGLQDEAPASAS